MTPNIRLARAKTTALRTAAQSRVVSCFVTARRTAARRRVLVLARGRNWAVALMAGATFAVLGGAPAQAQTDQNAGAQASANSLESVSVAKGTSGRTIVRF